MYLTDFIQYCMLLSFSRVIQDLLSKFVKGRLSTAVWSALSIRLSSTNDTFKHCLKTFLIVYPHFAKATDLVVAANKESCCSKQRIRGMATSCAPYKCLYSMVTIVNTCWNIMLNMNYVGFLKAKQRIVFILVWGVYSALSDNVKI